jgi:hypothetical protein
MMRYPFYGWGVVEDGYVLWWNPSLRLMKKWFGRRCGKHKHTYVRMPYSMATDMEE